jgi:Cu/Ag efflux protein CusF
MMKSTVLALAVVLLPGAAISSPAGDELETVVAVTQGAAVASRPATESLHGIVGSVDQGHDTIEIRLSPDKTEQFRVQDGLVFNSVRYGDQVEITVESIEGAKTIVGLRKQ